MVAFALAVVMLSQQLQVSARVSPDRVLLGDTVVLSVTVHSRGDEPVEIIDPPFTGFEVQGSREQSQVTLVGGLAARVTRRAVTLRPVRTGTLTIAPVQVRQGSEAIEAGVLTVVVAAAGAGAERVLGQRVRSLVARSPPPALTPEVVAATVLVSADTVVLGEQVDLVVVAWFPRSVRSRLRNPPTLRPPQLQGAWSYQRPSPAGIALSRQVNGIWYDLFVHHQAVFPLTVGVVNIGSAMVSFTLPLTYSFLSRELRHEVETRPLGVYVYPRPAPRVQGFLGAAGTGLRLEFDVDALEVALGGAISMAVTLAGTGNVALWPEPSIAWPAGLRVYPGDVEVSVAAEGGKLGGTKTFNYLAVADSVGAYGIPATAYAYYDTERRRYVELRTDPVAIVVAGGAPGGALLRGARPPLITSRRFQVWRGPSDSCLHPWSRDSCGPFRGCVSGCRREEPGSVPRGETLCPVLNGSSRVCWAALWPTPTFGTLRNSPTRCGRRESKLPWHPTPPACAIDCSGRSTDRRTPRIRTS